MAGKSLGRIEITYVGERRKYPFDKMEPGDWFHVPLYAHDKSIEVLRNSIMSAATYAARKTGYTYKTNIKRAGEICIEVTCATKEMAQKATPVRTQTYTLNPPRGSSPRSITLMEESRREILDHLMWELRYIDASQYGHPVFVMLGPTYVEIGSGLKEMYEPSDGTRFVDMATFQRFARVYFKDLTVEQMCAYTNSWLAVGKPDWFTFNTQALTVEPAQKPAGKGDGTAAEIDATPF